MADDDDVDLGDVVDSLDRMNQTQNLLGLMGTSSAIQRSREAREMNARLSGLQQAEQARQQAEAARAEQEYLGAHCPWCHSSLAGTPPVCAACTRAIVWLRMPLDVAVDEFISDNLHTFKEVYRELLGASVLFDLNQKLVHVPLSSQQEVAETQKRLQPLNEKLAAYIIFWCHVVERRRKVVATCPKCQSEVFERALVPTVKGDGRVCPPCEPGSPFAKGSLVGVTTLAGLIGGVPLIQHFTKLGNYFVSSVFERALVPTVKGDGRVCPPCEAGSPFAKESLVGVTTLAGLIVGVPLIQHFTNIGNYFVSSTLDAIGDFISAVAIVFWIIWRILLRIKIEKQELDLAKQRTELKTAAEFPMNALSLGAKTTNGLFNLIDLRTKALEELLNRVDEAALPKRIASESGDAGREFANQLDAVATGSSEPVMQPFKTPVRNVVVSRAALTADAAEFTAVGKQKPLSADSPAIRAVALALVAMKTVDAATVRACEDRLARKLIEITPYELTKSVRVVGAGVKEAKLQFVFEQLCDSLKAEPEFMKSKHRAVAEVIAELLPKEGAAVPGNANGPKVIRALCKVLNS